MLGFTINCCTNHRIQNGLISDIPFLLGGYFLIPPKGKLRAIPFKYIGAGGGELFFVGIVSSLQFIAEGIVSSHNIIM